MASTSSGSQPRPGKTDASPGHDPKPPARAAAPWRLIGAGCLMVAALVFCVIYVNRPTPTEVTNTFNPITPGAFAGKHVANPAGLNGAAWPQGYAPADGESGGMRPIQAMVGRFHVYQRGAVDAKGKRRPLVVSLPAQWTDAPSGIIHSSHFGTIGRELVNQAFLLAARDELGIASRDVTLGDVLPKGPPDLFLEIITPYQNGEPLTVTVRRGGEQGKELLARSFPFWTEGERTYPLLVAKAEALSRGSFVEVLKQVGLTGQVPPAKEQAGLDHATEDHLATMAFTAQFAALRALHAETATEGESPERLAALARAYALLGVLTEYHWSPANKLFKARSLLYAERLAAREPNAPRALQVRAFARALVGLHAPALDDLARANKASRAEDAAVKPPAWVRLVDAYCHFDTGRLSPVKEGPEARLAQFLRFLTAEDYYTALSYTADTARDTLQYNPECFRILDGLCRSGGLGSQHQATSVAPVLLAAVIPKGLREMGDLPDSLKAIAWGKPEDLAVTQALHAAGTADKDSGEPSWSALGRLVEEHRFVQVWRRARFLREMWGVSTDEYLNEVRPLVADHPYRGWIESYADDPSKAPVALRTSARQLNPADAELVAMPFIGKLKDVDQDAMVRLQISAQRHGDEVYRDLDISTRLFDDVGVSPIPFPFRLQALSPFAPLAASFLITYHWDVASPHADDWETRYGQHPQVLIPLATKYHDLNRDDDERRCLEKVCRLYPSRLAIERLADLELKQGHADRWKSLLDNYLEQTDDDGLEHAQVRVKMANQFMNQGDYASASPYAEAAGETWANWAMTCAERCAEGQKEWKTAELWARRISERYPHNSWAEWALFCKRTGRGDDKSAMAFAVQYVDDHASEIPASLLVPAVGTYLLNADAKKATSLVERAAGVEVQDLVTAFFFALTADAAGNAASRDVTLEWIINHPELGTRGSSLATMMRKSLASDRNGGLDPSGVDRLLKEATEQGRGNLAGTAAWFLMIHNRLDDAKPYLQIAARSPYTFVWFKAIAADTLRRRFHEAVNEGKLPREL